jgi:hypothetical protein
VRTGLVKLAFYTSSAPAGSGRAEHPRKRAIHSAKGGFPNAARLLLRDEFLKATASERFAERQHQ